MELNKKVPVLAGAVLVALLLFFYSGSPDDRVPFVIVGNQDYLATFLDTDTVVVRAVYPFSDAQGAVAAVTYLSTVLSAKGKRVILQTVEGNVCYTNEGNVEEVKEKPLTECELNYPTFEIREGDNRVVVSPFLVTIYGEPPYLMPAASYILKKLYPDADEVYREAMKLLSKRRAV